RPSPREAPCGGPRVPYLPWFPAFSDSSLMPAAEPGTGAGVAAQARNGLPSQLQRALEPRLAVGDSGRAPDVTRRCLGGSRGCPRLVNSAPRCGAGGGGASHLRGRVAQPRADLVDLEFISGALLTLFGLVGALLQATLRDDAGAFR